MSLLHHVSMYILSYIVSQQIKLVDKCVICYLVNDSPLKNLFCFLHIFWLHLTAFSRGLFSSENQSSEEGSEIAEIYGENKTVS